MSFKIQIHSKIGCSLQDVGRQELDHAIHALKSAMAGLAPEIVHTVRKRIKKLRAITLLLRSAIGAKMYRRINKALRAVGRNLGGLRDTQTRIKTLHKLQKRFFPGKRLPGFQALKERFTAEVAAVSKSRSRDKEQHAESLQSILTEFRQWDLSGFTWKDARKAIRRSYKRAQAGFVSTVHLKERGCAHEWRKRVKELWYHIRLIRRASPDAMEELAQDLEILSEFLGDDHDLVVLRSAIKRERQRIRDDKFVETTCELIDLRRNELLVAAHDMCGRIFAESPSQFVSDLDEKRTQHRKRNQKEKRLVEEFVGML